ncbi:replication/maintenance protein RepL [Streptomyces sp. NPDC058157]|uniref:replication/maintenance protein RepL n=1 Tax=Streptomyces sp. NPDC058157 TaxID=3346360 RepID=UPI0036E9F7A3
MPRRSQEKINSIEAVDELSGEMRNFKIHSTSEPDYAYGFAGQKFSMIAHEMFRVMRHNRKSVADYDLLSLLIELQNRSSPGLIIYKKQSELGDALGVAQSKISVSMKVLRELHILRPINRSAVMLNPQFVYCGSGRDHGAAIKAIPDGNHYRRQPESTDRKAA